MTSARNWIFSLGELCGHSLIHQDGTKFLTSDGVWHDFPPIFTICGTAEDVKQRLCECIDRFSEALEQDDNAV